MEAAAYVHIPFCSAVCPYCDFAVVAGAEDKVDRYVDAVLAELDTEHIAPTAQTIELENILRDDAVEPSLDADEVLALAPERAGQYFVVPPILGEHGN